MGQGRNRGGSPCSTHPAGCASGTEPRQVLQEPLLFPEGLQGFLQGRGAQGRGVRHNGQGRPRSLLHHVPSAPAHTGTPLFAAPCCSQPVSQQWWGVPVALWGYLKYPGGCTRWPRGCITAVMCHCYTPIWHIDIWEPGGLRGC